MAKELRAQLSAQDALNQVILGIAHELNNPNAFVRMNATNLKKMLALLQPCLREYEQRHPDEKFGPFTLSELRATMDRQLQSILGATVRIIAVADRLKQCTADSLEQRAKVPMGEVVREAFEDHGFLFAGCAELSFDYDLEKNYFILGHRLQLGQAVSVLLTNAHDAISERQAAAASPAGRLEVALTETDREIRIRVADNGCGMSPEVLEKARVPYFTTKPQGQGDGLGLPICNAIVRQHGGRLEIRSTEGQGTEMIIILPTWSVARGKA